MNTRGRGDGDHVEMIDMSSRASRYTETKADNAYYLDHRGLEITPELLLAKKSFINNFVDLHPVHLDFNNSMQNEFKERLSGDMLEFRKGAIIYIYCHLLGSPPPDLWAGIDGTILNIMNRLSLPRNSRTRVTEVLKARYEFDLTNEEAAKQSGRPRLIVEGSDEAIIIILTLEKGLGLGNATILVNEHRREKGDDPVSYSAVQRYSSSSAALSCTRRATKKSGNDDKGSIWANARVNQARQLIEELDNGKLSEEAIVWWDEKHKKCILGCCTKDEWRVCRNEAGVICDEAHGGKFPDKLKVTSVKFPKEARGIFGAALVRVDGVLKGVKAAPFQYTDKMVIGPASFEKKIKAEVARVKTLKGIWSGGQGYEGKYGENWREHVIKKVHTDGHICIIDLMDHVINESIKIYEGTVHEFDFFLFHDGLSAWWEEGAQAYMASRGFKDRQIKNNNDGNKTTRYHQKVVGDSPEICRALDSHGFAHLEQCIKMHVALTSCYEIDDPRRFKLGTPKEVYDTLQRCWTIAPTSEQIIEDIMGFRLILEKIVAAEGCVIADEYLRTGRRARGSDGSELKKNPGKRQRISTNINILLHPDAVTAMESINKSKEDILKAINEADDSEEEVSQSSDSEDEDS
jgi:hypothetical protein